MTEVKQRYLTLFDEINILGQTIGTKEPKKALDDFIDFLIDAYVEGFAGAAYFLNANVTIDINKISSAINFEYDGESIFDKFLSYYTQGDSTSLHKLMESEIHRVYNSGGIDSAEQSGKNVYKRWVTVGDDAVRDTHRYLEGQSIPLSEYFTTFDGDFSLIPGGFTQAENNANCRCILQYEEI